MSTRIRAARNRSNRRPRNNVGALARSFNRSLILSDRVVNPRPLPFDASIHFRQKFRFRAQQDLVSYAINTPDFLNLLGIVTSSTTDSTTQAPLFTRIRIIKVAAYAISPSVGATVTLSWTSDTNVVAATNTENTQTDTSESADRYAMVKLRPRPGSTVAQWQSINTVGAGFQVTIPENGTLDVTLEGYLNNNDPYNLFGVSQPTVVTPIPVGTLLLNPLDSNGASASYLWPVGYNNSQSPPTPTLRPTS